MSVLEDVEEKPADSSKTTQGTRRSRDAEGSPSEPGREASHSAGTDRAQDPNLDGEPTQAGSGASDDETMSAQGGAQETDAAADPAQANEPEADFEDLGKIRQRNIQRALRKAQSMLTLAIEKGIELNPEVVTPINAAVRGYGTSDWSGKMEDDFFTAYSRMSRDLGDVSSETIAWSRRWGTLVTVLVASLGGAFLVALILLQYRVIYLHDSSTIYVATEKELIQSEDRLSEIAVSLPLLEFGLSELRPQVAASGDETPEQSARADEMAAQIDSLTTERATLEQEIGRLQTQLRAQYAILSEWVNGLDDGPAPTEPWRFAREEVRTAYEEEYAAWLENQETIDPHELQYGVQQALSQLRLLNDFILPSIYGVLGTVAFVLRQISVGLQSQSLSLGSMLNYLVRLPLGGLAGIAVGLLLRPDEAAGGIEALQPLALAFVAGYSVELLFAAMDRLVGAFSGARGQS